MKFFEKWQFKILYLFLFKFYCDFQKFISDDSSFNFFPQFEKYKSRTKIKIVFPEKKTKTTSIRKKWLWNWIFLVIIFQKISLKFENASFILKKAKLRSKTLRFHLFQEEKMFRSGRDLKLSTVNIKFKGVNCSGWRRRVGEG